MTGLRLLIPLLLLVLPLFSYPLQWKKIFSSQVPLWGEVQAVTLAVIGLCAAGALFAAPLRLKRLWQVPRLRFLLIFAGAGVATACLQHLIYPGPAEYIFTSFFFFLLPVAGMIFSSELKRLMPCFAVLLFIPAIIVTLRTPDFSGWAGNWNWNFSLLAAASSAYFLLFFRNNLRKAILWGAGCITLALILVSCFKPEVTPRGTFAGLIGATLCLAIFRNIAPKRRWAFALWAVILTLVLFTGSVGNVFEHIRDSRFQLWRGSLECTLAHFPIGVGFDRFESMINANLPEIYYFTPFAASRHPHPHNEFLNYAVSYGLAGAIFFVLLCLNLLRGLRFRDHRSVWLCWIVLLLCIHGQFDVLLSIPQTGVLFLLGAGVLAGNSISKLPPGGKNVTANAGKIICVILFAFAFILAVNCGKSGYFLREARLALFKKNTLQAEVMLKKSLNSHVNANALYTAGAVSLFNFRNPDLATGYLERIRNDLGLPMVYHSNALLARAFAIKGEYAKAINYSDEELKFYPFSALASGLRLSVLRQANADDKAIAEENIRFSALMKMRGLKVEEFSKLLRNQELDDAPLKTRDDE